MAEGLNSLHRKLLEISSKFPDKIAIQRKTQDGFDNYTYLELVKKSKAIGSWLINEGIKRGERVAVILDNCPEWVISYFGILFSGAVVVPLDPQLSNEEVYNLLMDSHSQMIFSSKNKISLLREMTSRLNFLKKVILVDSKQDINGFVGFPDREIKDVDKTSWPEVNSDDVAALLYTSGTVAKPKGVMLTQGNFLANFNSCNRLNLYSDKDSFISILPLFHAYAFMGTLILPLFTGARIVYPVSLKSHELQDCMRDAKVSILIGVPQVFSNIHKAIFDNINKLSFFKRVALTISIDILWKLRTLTGLNLAKIFLAGLHSKFGRHLRYLVSGGARLDTKVALELFKLGFTILEGYGLTETAPIVTFNLPRRFKIGSVGRVLSDISIKIDNPDGTGVGEVIISGGNVMKGYFNRPEQTQEVLKEGWFFSGDLGYIDRKGYLYITGRAKEVIVLSSGKNIYPEEVESYYGKAISIKELCLLEIKDTRGIDRLQAVVVPNFDYFKKAEGGNIFGKIKWEFENISYNLPTYKRITGFIVTKDDLPRTRLGKIKRYEVRQRFLEEFTSRQKLKPQWTEDFSAEDLKLINSSIGSKVIEYIKNALSLKEKPRLDGHLELDLGMDSLSKVELIAGLEKLFGVSISDKQAQEITNIRQIISKLKELVYERGKEEFGLETKEPSWDALLRSEPPDEVKKKIELTPTIINRIFTLTITNFLFAIFKIFWRIKVEGKHNIPKAGPFVFYVNHSSYLDGFITAITVPFSVRLNLYFLGWKQIFEHPTIKWSNRMARLIPIDSAAELMSTMQVASFLLRNGKSICMFPEGQRTIDGKIKEFKRGIGILVKELDVPVIPVVIKGAFDAWSRMRRLPRPHPIKVIFGKPLTYRELLAKIPKDSRLSDYKLIASYLREELIRLISNSR